MPCHRFSNSNFRVSRAERQYHTERESVSIGTQQTDTHTPCCLRLFWGSVLVFFRSFALLFMLFARANSQQTKRNERNLQSAHGVLRIALVSVSGSNRTDVFRFSLIVIYTSIRKANEFHLNKSRLQSIGPGQFLKYVTHRFCCSCPCLHCVRRKYIPRFNSQFANKNKR